ncbi:MAG: Gfo/Idh/MocA family oxidoreductase [Ignavibacteriales bacterium]|nr:Gfo/Idh/MocA family oxidoreductase [Ignavibacteriales bacterium]
MLFIAPNHPQCLEHICLPSELIQPISTTKFTNLVSDKTNDIHYGEIPELSEKSETWYKVIGWSSYSGIKLSPDDSKEVFIYLKQIISRQQLPIKTTLKSTSRVIKVNNTVKSNGSNSNNITAVLFGYGQYAKTNIIPNLNKRIVISRIHEIDPCQLGPIEKHSISLDTSPYPHIDNRFDIYFVAGYHHTHTPIALHALSKNAYAVVEKPIATTRTQLNEILEVLKSTSGNLFACFQKRYLPFNEFVFLDMQLRMGDPINYHCIVYEVKLPERHWYHWPNSQSRIVSNGTHWIDHFLYLNNYSNLENYNLWHATNGDVICVAELENGATFSMTLTDHGSGRIGMQEYIELRSNNTTIRIKNSSDYFAENQSKIIRSKKTNKMDAYSKMYLTISERIVKGLPGDSRESIYSSTDLMLKYEEMQNS